MSRAIAIPVVFCLEINNSVTLTKCGNNYREIEATKYILNNQLRKEKELQEVEHYAIYYTVQSRV